MKISDVEKEALYRLGRGTVLEYDRTESLVSIMRSRAQMYPDRSLIVYKDRSYSYKEADEITDRLARQLLLRGLEREEAVGIMLGRSELLFMYSMAVMKAGGSYMPLDPHFPEERLNFMCEDAKVRLILSEGDLVSKAMPSFGGTVLTADDLSSGDDHDDISLPRVVAQDRMIILYTSGSTGKPKGVELEHGGIVNYCYWYVNEYGIVPEDRAVGYANYGFDAHMLDLYSTMLAGACVYIIPEDMRLDLVGMSDYIDKNRLTIAFMTTQIGCQMATLFKNRSMRLLTVAGEKMPPMTPPDYRLDNLYGPTECSMGSTFYRVNSYFEGEYIGRAISNCILYIVDENLEPVPMGESGELLIAGAGVARGYLNRPELTREKFVTFEGQRAYRSGDLVRWATDPRDGSRQIEFLGRIDNQVKIRGLRIELGEIENRAATFAGVRQACVDAKKIGSELSLVCYYTVKSGMSVDEGSLKEWIAAALAAFMVPKLYVKLEELPLTPNGKVNRHALPIPAVKRGATECVPPESDKEKILFEIACELLKDNSFGVTDKLSELGMSSVTAIRLAVMAKERGITLKVGDILAYDTIRDISNHVMRVISWYKPYDPSKEIMVLVSGIFSEKYNRPRMDIWSKDLNILFIEPVDEHFVIFKDDYRFDEVISFYWSLIDYNIEKYAEGNRIVLFGGFCLGGYFAYRLAQIYKEQTGISPKVFVADTEPSYSDMLPWDTEEKEKQEFDILKKRLGPVLEEEGAGDEPIRIMLTKSVIASKIVSGTCLSRSDLEVLFFKAESERDGDAWVGRWRKLVNNLTVVDIPSDHFSMCMDVKGAFLKEVCDKVRDLSS